MSSAYGRGPRLVASQRSSGINTSNNTKLASKNYDLPSSPGIQKSKMTTQTNKPAMKLRTVLRRVMSDRVLKITQCSQQQNVEKVKQRQALPSALVAEVPNTIQINSPAENSNTNNTNTEKTDLIQKENIQIPVVNLTSTKFFEIKLK